MTRRMLSLALAVVLALFGIVPQALAQDETNSAKATRKRLQQKITVDLKDVRFKDALDELKREMDNRVSFKVDNVSGISNNTKVNIVAKDKTLEQVLNDLCDK